MKLLQAVREGPSRDFIGSRFQDVRELAKKHRTTKRAIRHAQSETVGRAISKLAPRHDESDPTRAKCPEDREGCGSMREWYQHLNRATTRAIGQSHERFARAHARFSENIAHTSKNENWQCRKRCSVMFCLGFGQLFSPTAEYFGVFSHSKGFGADRSSSKTDSPKVPRFQVKVPK